MDQNPEQLRQEIAATRQGMTNTIDAIGDHVSPGRIIERRKNRVVGTVAGARDRLMGTATNSTESVSDGVKGIPDAVSTKTQGSPLGAGLVAFGLGFVAAAVFPPSAREKQMAGQLMANAEPLKDELVDAGKEMAEGLKAPAQESLDNVKESATTAAQEVKSSATDAADNVKQTVAQDDDVAATTPAPPTGRRGIGDDPADRITPDPLT